MSKFVIF
jgi:hypothetical protein